MQGKLLKQLANIASSSTCAEAIISVVAPVSSLVGDVQWSSRLCTFPRLQFIQTNPSCCLISGMLCLFENICSSLADFVGSANDNTGYGCYTLGSLPTQLLFQCLFLSVLLARMSERLRKRKDRERDRDPETATDRERLPWSIDAEFHMLLSHEFEKRPRLYICLGIIACTSVNEAFKWDAENKYIYSQKQSDISSFFQGQVPTLLCSVPLLVAAGECV